MRRHQAVKNVKSWWPQDTKSGWQSQQPRPGLQITVGSCTKIRPHLVQKRTYLSGKIHQLRVESMKCRVLLNKALFMTVIVSSEFLRESLVKGSVWNHILARQVRMSRRKHCVIRMYVFATVAHGRKKLQLARVEKDTVIFGTFQP